MSNQEQNLSFLSNLQSPQHHYNTKKNQLLEDATYTYTYDSRGNLKGKVNKATKAYTFYTFNGLNQLTAVYTANQKDEITHYLRYEYDAFNRRVSKEENTVKHTYLYDKENIIAILDKDKNHLATIVHHPTLIDTPLSITNIHGTFYYHEYPKGISSFQSGHHQGSIVALTDEQGQVVEQITYDNTYGKVIKHTQKEENLTLNPYGYTGREMDAHDLYYYRARYYDPTTQRFLSLDPIGYQAGDFNFYRYVGNDPVNYVDPFGLYTDPRLAGAGVPAAMGGRTTNSHIIESGYSVDNNKVDAGLSFTNDAISHANEQYKWSREANQTLSGLEISCHVGCEGTLNKMSKHDYSLFNGECSGGCKINLGDIGKASTERKVSLSVLNIELPHVEGKATSKGSIMEGKHKLEGNIGCGGSLLKYKVSDKKEGEIENGAYGDKSNSQTDIVGGYSAHGSVKIELNDGSVSGSYKTD